MTEKACKQYQMHEYGQACSGCKQMNVPAINFVQEEGGHCWHYVKMCVYCGTQEPSEFRKGFNRICEKCKKLNSEVSVIRSFNPSMKERKKKPLDKLKYGCRKGDEIEITCPSCKQTRRVIVTNLSRVGKHLYCRSCARKAKRAICIRCGKQTRISSEDVERMRLQLCIGCMKLEYL